MTADIGLVGAGVMGSALALNLADNGYKVAGLRQKPAQSTDLRCCRKRTKPQRRNHPLRHVS